MKVDYNLVTKPIGEILEEAGLINQAKIQVALAEQNIYNDLKLGEILVLHGWLNERTANFFGEEIKSSITQQAKKQIGQYFYDAGLISKEDLQAILNEQKKLGIKFGSVAVMRGCVQQKTLDFFLKYFCSEDDRKTNFSYRNQQILKEKELSLKVNNKKKNLRPHGEVYSSHRESAKQLTMCDEDFEIPWID